jgi:hypothetical protein
MPKGNKQENSNDREIIFLDPNDLVGFIDESMADEAATPARQREEYGDLDALADQLSKDTDLTISNELIENAEEYVIKRQEDTRGKLAVIYTIATFIIFILGFGVAIMDASTNKTSIIDNLQKILPLLSGIFLGTLGFVLGYYFRTRDEK